MNFKRYCAGLFMVFLICIALAEGKVTGMSADLAQPKLEPQESSEVDFIAADELKTRIANHQPVTIIDVRANYASGSERKIQSAIHVKLRRLKSRLFFAPLKDAPRDRDVVTYCACPSDEASIRAAQVLREAGFKRVRVLKGGWVAWQKINGQTENVAKGM